MTPTTPAARALSDSEFHQLAHAVLAQVEATVDRWLDADVVDIDSQRTGGLLELSLPGGSKIILNTQPPLHEIWLAARAGGHHYRHVDGQWRDTRDGTEFFTALSQHASAQAGLALQFDPASI
jgi:CyaY protein